MYRAHKIAPNLFQGGLPPPGDGLKQAGVDVLVLCAAGFQDASAYEGIEVILAPGDDDSRPHRLARFIDGWKDAARVVVDRVKEGKNVLVTCYAGQNRSGLVVALAMRELTGKKGSDIVQHIQTSRPLALNNLTFVKYVEDAFSEEAK